jgi:uncharacterized membrane protein
MMNTLNTPAAQLVGGLLIAAAVGVAFLIGDDPGSGLASGAIVAAFALVLYFGRRRSESVQVMSGIGDERTRHLYQRATAFAGSVMAFVLPAWWLVTVAQGDPDTTLNFLCGSSDSRGSRRRSCWRGGDEDRAQLRDRGFRLLEDVGPRVAPEVVAAGACLALAAPVLLPRVP